MASRQLLFPWSKEALAMFMQFGATGQGWNIRAGLDAAVLEDLPQLAQALTRLWINEISKLPKRTLKLTQGDNVVELPVTEQLMIDLLKLDE